jgi:hypothetical protein
MATPYTEFRNDELASQTNVAAGSGSAAFRYRASFIAETAPGYFDAARSVARCALHAAALMSAVFIQ